MATGLHFSLDEDRQDSEEKNTVSKYYEWHYYFQTFMLFPTCMAPCWEICYHCMHTPPNFLCVSMWFCWCETGPAAVFIMRMYGPRCRLPSACTSLGMHTISLTFLSLPLPGYPSFHLSFFWELSLPLSRPLSWDLFLLACLVLNFSKFSLSHLINMKCRPVSLLLQFSRYWEKLFVKRLDSHW